MRDERRRQKEEEEERKAHELEAEPSDSGETVSYNYGNESEEEGEESDESSHFMEDRQTDEDYSAYRERIFDWSPRKGKNDDTKSLVEEIPGEKKTTAERVVEEVAQEELAVEEEASMDEDEDLERGIVVEETAKLGERIIEEVPEGTLAVVEEIDDLVAKYRTAERIIVQVEEDVLAAVEDAPPTLEILHFTIDTEDSSSGSEADEDEPYYKVLDVAEETKCSEDGSTVSMRNRLIFKSIKKNLDDIRELMDWNFKPPSLERRVVLKPWNDEEAEESDIEDSDAFKLMESALRKEKKPEFEIKEPESMISETDVIMYAKNIKNSINTLKQNEIEISDDMHRILTASKTFTVMEMQQNTIIRQEEDDDDDDDDEETSIVASRKISRLRGRMSEFKESLDAFTVKYKQQYDALIKKYNDDCNSYDEKMTAVFKKEKEENLKKIEEMVVTKVDGPVVEMKEEEFMQQMEDMVGEGNLNFFRGSESEDAEVARLNRAHESFRLERIQNEKEAGESKLNWNGESDNGLEREEGGNRNIIRTLEMQLAEED